MGDPRNVGSQALYFPQVAMILSAAISAKHKITWKAHLLLLLLETFSRNLPTTLARGQERT